MKIENQIDRLMHQIDWDSVSEQDRVLFTNSILALEIGFREKEKSSSVLSSQYSLIFFIMVMLSIMLMTSCEASTMLIGCVITQMVFFAYWQFTNWMTYRIFDKINFSLLGLLQVLQKKHPLE